MKYTKKLKSLVRKLGQNQTGFSIVEIVVGTVVIGIMVIALTNTFIAINVIQRRSANLSLATRIGEQKIESLRNNHYNTLPISPPPLDFTNELPAQLAGPRSATVTISEPQPGIKRLDISISYREGRQTKNLHLSSLIGNLGISQ